MVHFYNMEKKNFHNHNAEKQFAFEERRHALGKCAERKLRVAFVLSDNLDDVDQQADFKQNDNRLRPDVRLERIGIARDTRGHSRFQHVGKERIAKEDEEQNVDNQFKHSAVTPLPLAAGKFFGLRLPEF